MPKAEVGTPKWLSNKMKAKGLQKLKWYCQMCEKQCRDENGFKCHRLSDGHQRQMVLFCENANKFMDNYSRIFEKEFMKLMKTKYCRRRVLANTVYIDMISDKKHIHMNSTIWVTLSDFVLYLGKTGKCKIDYTERGWYIEYIDREKIEREKRYLEKKKIEDSYEKLKEKKINNAIMEAKQSGKFIIPEYTPIQKKNDEKIVLSSIKINKNENINNNNVNIFLQKSLKKNEELNKKGLNIIENNKKRTLSTLELIVFENEQKKKKNNINKQNTNMNALKNNIINTYQNKENENYLLLRRKEKWGNENIFSETNNINNFNEIKYQQNNKYNDNNNDNNNKYENDKDDNISSDSFNNCWICPNIYVKVIDKNHKYYKKKGIIKSISKEKKKCKIEIDNKHIFKAYQKQLQTVIPKINGDVLILNGKYKGMIGKVKKIILEEESVEVIINDKKLGNENKNFTKKILYDDISKLAYKYNE